MIVPTLVATPIGEIEEVRGLVKVNPAFQGRDFEDDLVRRLFDSGCILRGHFRLQSLQHSDLFLRFRDFSDFADNRAWAAQHLAEAIRQLGIRFQSIAAPDTAGSQLADEIGETMTLSSRILLLETDGSNHITTSFVGDQVRFGERVLLVNDVVTAGAGVRTMMQAVDSAGGRVEGLGIFASRATTNPAVPLENVPFPVACLFTLVAANHGAPGGPDNEKSCPICQSGQTEIIEARYLN